ncbi:MAG: gliding motility-associated C-terminal domain-containing protein [Sporocytophaga sp.]|uniref:SprB repeat-containing protein n=1 Tax=Sporocytophaga sp. TaxID=2231183 RepID=UPI001B063F23|nr:SprB repeat-containing protein [Sporocytophaga sp.]MBO9703221.1 gliding motility-associated C-terminal domain-containing protein [Sporocytophaga sp.]
MKEGVEYYFEIDQYLNGELKEDALAKFQIALAEDPALRDEVANQQLLNEVVLGAELDVLRDRIKKDIKQLDQKNNSNKWLLGGSLLLLISVATGLGIFNNIKSDKTTSSKSPSEKPLINVSDSLQSNGLSLSPNTKKHVNKKVWIKPQISNSSENFLDSVPSEIKNEITLQKGTEIIKSDTITTKSSVVKQSDACADVNINFTLSSTSSCINGATGEIKVTENSLKGGTAPYSYEFNGNGNFSSLSSYTNLRPGSYTVKVKDQSGCVKEKVVLVSEKECYKKQSFSFSPEFGETLKIPISSEEAGILSIYNRAGLLIFKTKTGQGEIAEWNGNDMTGNLAVAGLYVYIVEYSNGQKENGQITVLR